MAEAVIFEMVQLKVFTVSEILAKMENIKENIKYMFLALMISNK